MEAGFVDMPSVGAGAAGSCMTHLCLDLRLIGVNQNFNISASGF